MCVHRQMFANKFTRSPSYAINMSILRLLVCKNQLTLFWIRPAVRSGRGKMGTRLVTLHQILFSMWRDCKIRVEVYWWGNGMSWLFMFKLPARNGTTFEALEHNGALDKDSWERQELDEAERRPVNASEEWWRIVSFSQFYTCWEVKL